MKKLVNDFGESRKTWIQPLAIKHGNGTSTCIDHVPINDPIFIGLSIPRFYY